MTNTVTPSPAMTTPRIRLAMEQFSDSGWTGGQVYIQNLLKALRALPESDRPLTILTRQQGESPYTADVDQFIEIPPVPRPGSIVRFKNRVLREIGKPQYPKYNIAGTMAENRVDALFTQAIYRGSIRIPLIGWLPDFQYLHLPEMYSPDELQNVRKYHEDLIAQSKVLLVSSNDALNDLKTFSPQAAQGAHVVPFVAQLPPGVYDSDPGHISRKYHLPERFFYLPNQFWKHKNHSVVVKALKILADRSVDVCVVCTGSLVDARNPTYFSSLLMEVATQGVHDRFKILGLVPRADVYHLNRQSLTLLQPSLFEGWSTSIEEAKSIGKRVVASDLPIHREQIPEAEFFAPQNAESLADCLEKVAEASVSGPDLEREAKAKADFPGRELEFARRFSKVIRQAVSK